MTLLIKTTGLEDYIQGGDARIKALILGAPGCGKTRSSSFWPKPLLLDFEEGRMSVADRAIPYADIKTSLDLDSVLTHLEREQKNPNPLERKYGTLIIDTADAVQKMKIKERCREQNKEGLSGWADWGWLDGQMTNFLNRVLDLNMNVVVNVHVKTTKSGGGDDGEGGFNIFGPKLKGDSKESILEAFDLIGFMDSGFEMLEGVSTQTRQIQWWADPQHPTLKDRSGTLPKFTSITFTPGDYDQLLDPIAFKLDALAPSQAVEEIEQIEVVAPVVGVAGGPVAAKKTAAKKTAAPKTSAATPPGVAVTIPPVTTAAAPAAAAPAAAPVAAVAPAAKKVAAPPAAAPRPVVAPPVAAAPVVAAPMAAVVAPPTEAPVEVPVEHEEAAVAMVAEALGGEVVSAVQHPVAAPAPVVATPVAAPTAASLAAVGAVEAPPEVTGLSTPSTWTVACGQPVSEGEDAVAGCGEVLLLTDAMESVSEVLMAEQNTDLITIAKSKTRTWLCNADYAAHRAASN